METKGRNCDGCTKCCEGWLPGMSYEHRFWKGRPCHYVSINSGCTIYNDRPSPQCTGYKCEWLTNNEIPEWIKPSNSNTIITRRPNRDGTFRLEMIEAGAVLDVRVLSWFLQYCYDNDIDAIYDLHGGSNMIKFSSKKGI